MTYLEAIIQHFGLPAGRVFPPMGAPFGGVALAIQLSPEDHGAIGRLMGDDVIRVAVSGKAETNDIVRHADEQSSWGNWRDPDGAQRAAHRKEYNALSPEEREPYGNFMGFVADKGGRDPYTREVQHVDVPEEELAGIPPHVWLYRNMLTDLQAVAPIGRDETNGQYAVAIDQLTGEQIQVPHIRDQLLAMAGAETRRLEAQLDVIDDQKLRKNNT